MLMYTYTRVDMYVHVCVCVDWWQGMHIIYLIILAYDNLHINSTIMHAVKIVSATVYKYVCIHVCIYIYVYIIHVCMCVCMREQT